MCVGEKQKVIPAQAGVLGTEVSPAPLAEMPGHSETKESLVAVWASLGIHCLCSHRLIR